MYSLLPLLTLVVPIFAGALCLFTSFFKFLEPFATKAAKISLLLGISFTLIAVMSMLPYAAAAETLETPSLHLRVDLTNIAGMTGVVLIFFLTSIYNIKAEKGGRLKPGVYNFFLLLLLACMLGLLLSDDLFLIFLFVELVIGVSVILVAHNPSKLSTEAAFKYLIITAISALFVLLGTLIVFFLTGESNILTILSSEEIKARLVQNPQWLMLAVACFIIGLGADIGIVPFHGWLPDVFPGSTIIINGFFCAEPIGLIFALYKVTDFFFAIYRSNVIVLLMVSVGLISMIFGALMAYPQKNFYRMLAYCSIEEYGHIIFALSLFSSQLGFVAGQYYLVNSALMKTGLILSLGSVYFSTGTGNMDLLGGLLGKMSKTGLSYVVCALSLAGVPPLSGFYAKWLLYSAAYDFLGGAAAAISVVVLFICVAMISFVFLIRSFHRVFMGQSSENLKEVKEVHFAMWLPTIIVAVLAVLLGLQPNVLLGLISAA